MGKYINAYLINSTEKDEPEIICDNHDDQKYAQKKQIVKSKRSVKPRPSKKEMESPNKFFVTTEKNVIDDKMSEASSQLGVSRKIKWDEDNGQFNIEQMDHLNTNSEILNSRPDKKKKKSKSKKKTKNNEDINEEPNEADVNTKTVNKNKKQMKVTHLNSIQEGSKNVENDDSAILKQKGSKKEKKKKKNDDYDDNEYVHNPQHNMVAVQSVNPQARLTKLREPGDNNPYNINTSHHVAPIKSINPLVRATDEETLSSSTPQNKKAKVKSNHGLQAEDSVIPNPQHISNAIKPPTKNNALMCDDDTIATNPHHDVVAIKSINPQANMASLSAPDR